ncbi:hypothetical protein [Microbacterium sp. PA5]|uniref:hypothetical protein n=1 Tax=Microbacterium sp. PA5 TaxID=3416654 RepID=UPI003CEA9E34
MNYRADTVVPPGRALGIWAFVLAFVFPVLGLIFGIIAVNQSRRANVSNKLAIAGIIISVLVILAAVITTVAVAAAGGFPPK